MCARYTMKASGEAIAKEFEAIVSEGTVIEAHYNIAPTMNAPVVRETSAGDRVVSLARFGLLPHWAKDRRAGSRMLNARLETVATSGAFKYAFARQRCLVVADGFFEWRTEGKAKKPFWIRPVDGELFGMAGLWSMWNDPKTGTKVPSFAILTRPAIGATATLHDRMPIVLPRESYAAWLDREAHDASEILERHRGEELRLTAVSTRVNSVRNDDPACVEPLTASDDEPTKDRVAR